MAKETVTSHVEGAELESAFLDNAEMTVDSKFRVGVPERFMKTLKALAPGHADKVGVIPAEDGSLKLLPYPDYVKRVAYWRTLNDRVAAERTIKKFETSLAKLLPLDAQNRIKLTQAHIDFCGAEKEAMIVGAVECMQLYSMKGFREMIRREREQYSEASDAVEARKREQPAVQYVIDAHPKAAR